MIRKPVLKPVKCRLSSLGREDTETLIKIWNRVGRHRVNISDESGKI